MYLIESIQFVKLTKSWIITLIVLGIAIAMPIINMHLPADQQIGAETLNYLLGLTGITSGVGAAAAARKAIWPKPAHATSLDMIPDIEDSVVPDLPTLVSAEAPGAIKYGPKSAAIQTNLKRGQTGATLPVESTLYVRAKGARSYVSVVLKDVAKEVIRVNQGSIKDADGDHRTTSINLSRLPRGVYYLTVATDAGSSDSIGLNNMKFKIV